MSTEEIDFDERVRLADAPREKTRADELRAALVTTTNLDDIPEPEPLIDKLLFLDSLAWLYGAPGCGKSFIAIDIAGCVGTGETWQSFPVRMRGPVLYLVAEGVSGVKQRVRAWEASMGVRMENVHFLPIAVQASNATEWAALIEVIADLKPVLVVVDTQARVTVGMEENSATEMGRFVQRVELLRLASGACILVIHHTGRGGEHMRGSIAMDGAASTLIKVVKADDILTIECGKQKDASEFDQFGLRMVPFETSIVLSGTDGFIPSTVDSPGVRKFVGEWSQAFGTDWTSWTRLVDGTGTPSSTLGRRIRALVNAGVVEEKGEDRSKRYRLRRVPESHESHISPIEVDGSGTSTPVNSPTVPPP